ncbi:peptidoglycan-binding LysM domain-containing protein [Striga hermonthica]|uniref:Peptidoglycan-binding LysM domain-containing protein n=1 Tax=Striga hermonthica TaxID=68872 RepID=A0A9N7P1T0_STRHE|nr:peptidoglycan-binding LysM domain-containing protein [Striga hermonthica]
MAASLMTTFKPCFCFVTILLLSAWLPEITCSSVELGGFFRGNNRFVTRACDEIYVVREGETLQTISEKCDDPFIVERNPHVHDPDDVFPGLVIKITPFSSYRS